MAVDIYSTPAHFAAEITILTEAQGGRRSPPHNYIRWDFGYTADAPADVIYMIWPNFLDKDGMPYPKGVPLSGVLRARMHIVAPKAVEFHRDRIAVGTAFNCHEGRVVVATGVVTRILALSE